MTRIKICCIQSVAEAECAARAGADAIGLVAAMPSGPGPIADEAIATITDAMRGRIMTVLLSAETWAEALIEHVARTQPAAVQLVDRVEADAIPALRAACPGLTVIQVIHVGGEKALDEAAEAAERADMLLLDSGSPDAELRTLGGTGRRHDWRLSRRIVEAAAVPVWLAGGLSPANAASAVREVAPWGLDICSGLRPHGRLDPRLLHAFMRAVRENGRQPGGC